MSDSNMALPAGRAAAATQSSPQAVLSKADIPSAAPCPQADHINDRERRLLEDANSWYSEGQLEEIRRKPKKRRMFRREGDIKAPDGYTLGGMRLVRKDGTILFGRGWWQAPLDWVGHTVWVHEIWISPNPYARKTQPALEAAHPGFHIYEARCKRPPLTVICERTERGDAKPAIRNPARKRFIDGDGRPTS